MQRIKKFLKLIEAKRLKVAVVGDAFVDQYFKVDEIKMSPEFPIPVLKRETEYASYYMPGGAGNLALQFKHFPVDVNLLTMLDSDATICYKSFGFKVDNCIDFRGRVPRKKRYYHNGFPVIRIDVEEKDHGLEKRIADKARNEICYKAGSLEEEIVLFSDYDKGVFDGRPLSEYKIKGMTIVDPKKGPLEKWYGCTIIKPNAKEAEELTGEDKWQKQCDVIMDKTNCAMVVITHNKFGVVGKCGGNYFEYRPKTGPVHCVIGAGDCYLAFLAMAIGVGMEFIEAAELACDVSSIYVQSRSTSYGQGYHSDPIQKCHLVPVKDKFAYPLKNNGVMVFANGCFDLLHAGHIDLLTKAKALGDVLVVGVNSDESIRKIKGVNRPIIPLQQRMQMLAALEAVDHVIPFEDEIPLDLIRELTPNILVKGVDWVHKEIIGADLVDEVVIIPFSVDVSTSKIEQKIQSQIANISN
jgi:D-beta-D-heptose 7-phosphate kinase/D-beta-D-heptose 1-phosphate adenosyltransferase